VDLKQLLSKLPQYTNIKLMQEMDKTVKQYHILPDRESSYYDIENETLEAVSNTYELN
jgi:hypothetical protein